MTDLMLRVEYHDAAPDEHGRRRYALHWLSDSAFGFTPDQAPAWLSGTVIVINRRAWFRRAQEFHAVPPAGVREVDWR